MKKIKVLFLIVLGVATQALQAQEMSYELDPAKTKIEFSVPATMHTVQVSRVGVINDKGRFSEVYASPQPIVPEPFPASRDRRAWERLLDELHQQWGGRWHNPGR